MSGAAPTFDDVLAAAGAAARQHRAHAHAAPPRCWTRSTGGTVLVKPEPLQRTGSFKLRGATNAALLMDPAARARGRGDAFLRQSRPGRRPAPRTMLGMPALIAMPADAPAIKARRRGAGARRSIPSTGTASTATRWPRGWPRSAAATLIPPFDHPHVIAGQGTLALELVEDAKAAGLTLDALAVCTGGGGLIAGCALAMEALAPDAEVWAVEPEGWDDTRRSLEAGRRIANDGTGSGLCDALLSKQPGRDDLLDQPAAPGRRRGGDARRRCSAPCASPSST